MDTFLDDFHAQVQCCKWHLELSAARHRRRRTISQLDWIYRKHNCVFPGAESQESPTVIALVNDLRSSFIHIKLLENRLEKVYREMDAQTGDHLEISANDVLPGSIPGTPERYCSLSFTFD